MVSYYNHHSFAMYQKSTNLSYTPSPHSWYPSNYHTAGGAQFLAANGDSSPQQLYYPQLFHQPSPDWSDHASFAPAGGPGQGGYLQTSLGIVNNHHQHNQALQNEVLHHGGGGGSGGNLMHNIPTPPITVAGSDIPTPASSGPTASITPPTPVKPPQTKSPYEWIKKSSYQNQPAPAFAGKTRTKDKYRVVYSDHQRLELEKEFHYTRYITIRRKSELAQALQLSERQVKIWFQNRRAKDRKQKKKVDSGTPNSSGMNTPGSAAANMSKYLDVNTKIEPFHLHNLHHSMGLSLHHSNHPVLHHSHQPSPIDASVAPGALSMN